MSFTPWKLSPNVVGGFLSLPLSLSLSVSLSLLSSLSVSLSLLLVLKSSGRELWGERGSLTIRGVVTISSSWPMNG